MLIRADASAAIGSGHVMRCLALAQAWQESGGDVTLAAASLPNGLRDRVESKGVRVVCIEVLPGSEGDAAATCHWAGDLNAQWIVVDGYRFGAAYQESVKEPGRRLLVIDDYGHAERYVADVVLNQNIDASTDLYRRRNADTKLLLGTAYALLRREFRFIERGNRNRAEESIRLLITLGGGDPQGMTVRVLEALAEVTSPLEVVIVVGGGNPHWKEIDARVAEMRGAIQVLQDVRNIAGLMQWADIAVSAGGSTCWELAFLGVPTVIVVLAENQRGIAEGLHNAGVSTNLGWHAEVTAADIAAAVSSLIDDPARRSEMSSRGRALVDGEGAVRVCKMLHEL